MHSVFSPRKTKQKLNFSRSLLDRERFSPDLLNFAWLSKEQRIKTRLSGKRDELTIVLNTALRRTF